MSSILRCPPEKKYISVFCSEISLRKNTSQLTIPTDIGEEERIRSHRQGVIEESLLYCYALEIVYEISNLVAENCNGCIIEHPSQKQHDCIMMESDERLLWYFDSALTRISEGKVMERFMNSLRDIKPSVNGLELLKYICHDWRTLFCTKQRRLLRHKTLELL